MSSKTAQHEQELEHAQQKILSLEKERDLCKTIINNMDEGVVHYELVYDENGKAIDYRALKVNPAFEHIVGVKRDKAIGKLASELFGIIPDHFPKFVETAETGKTNTFETSFSPLGKEFKLHIIQSEKGKFIVIFSDQTEGKRTREELKQEKFLLHALMENTPDHIYFKDKQSKFVRINKAQAKAFKLKSPEKAIGKTDFDFFAKAHALEAFDDEKMIMELGKPIINKEEKEILPNGNTVWVSTTKVPLLDNKDNIIGTFGISRDITEKKLQEQELEQERQYMQVLADNIPDTIYFKNLEGKFTKINKAQAEVLGVIDPDYAIGKTDFNYFTKEHAEAAKVDEQHIIKTETPLIAKIEQIRLASGEFKWVSATKMPLKNAKGKVTGTFGLSRDITELKETQDKLELVEQELRKTEKRLRAKLDYILSPDEGHETDFELGDLIDLETLQQIQDAFSNATDIPTVITDANGRPITKPTNYQKLCTLVKNTPLGLERCEKSTKDLGELSLKSLKPIFQECKSCGLIDGCAPIIVAGKHVANWMVGQCNADHLSEKKIKEYAKEIGGDEKEMVKAFRDIKKTDLNKFQKILDFTWQLAKEISVLGFNNLKLAKNNVELTLAEEERKNLNQELENKNKELEQIVYVTSHDLRSPLVNVQGFSNELKFCLSELTDILKANEVPDHIKSEISPILNEDIPDSLDYIFKSTDKMDGLLSGLLSLSRLGRSALIIEELDINKIMDEIKGSFEFHLQQSGTELEIEKLPNAIGDKIQVNQVFSNLIGNALKYLDKDRPGKIRIYARSENDKIVYCVQDNGVGISPAHQKKIFEIFHRLNPNETEGEGLGLTIVRMVLERLNGRVYVKSEPGKGSSFYVELPTKAA